MKSRNTPPPGMPVLSGQGYHQLFFQGEGRSLEPVPSGATTIAHFEIHRRDDFRYKCKDTIEANRLDFYLVFIVTGGEGIHTFGAETHYVRQNMLCFIGPHTITSWQTTVPDHQGYFCAFSEDFFNVDRADKGLLRSLPFFRVGGGASTLHLTPEQTDYFLALMQHMEADYLADAAGHAPLLRTQLQLLLLRAYALYRQASPRAEQRHSAGVALTNAFLALLDEDLAHLPLRDTTVARYADRLHVSPNHLNDMVRAHTGRPAGAVVQALVLRTATTYLAGTALPVAEVAHLLGFASAAYFARFVRRHTGQSPSQLRAGGLPKHPTTADSVKSAGNSVKPA